VGRRFNDGLDRPLATHVYNSFDRERFDPDRVEASPVREELGIAPTASLLGQVAQITPWKAQDTSIRALAQLHRDGVDAHLLIVGNIAFTGKGVRYDNQAYLQELHELVIELSLQNRVHFLGQRGDVPGILRELDLSLLPSWDEPFANVMLESMAMGTPLLVSSVGGGPELVEDGVTGRVLPPKRPEVWASAAGELLRDRQQLAHMGARARAVTTNFSDELHARDMLDVYEYVLAQPKPDPAAVVAAVPRRRDGAPSPASRSNRFSRDPHARGHATDAGIAGAGRSSG
jgi:glycosyltransferase involved in cell wall biosynthesis